MKKRRTLPIFQKSLAEFLRPFKKLMGSEWAEKNTWFSPEDSATRQRYSTINYPFQKEIIDAMTSIEYEQVVFMASSQVGKTILERIVIGYYIDQDPCPMLMVQPTLAMAEAFSKDRFMPFIRDSPVLRNKITDKARDGNSTIFHKIFDGGQLTITGANSPASLASRPIRIIQFDEIDRYDLNIGGEGDPISLGFARARRFWNRKINLVSTPGLSTTSRISREFEKSDKRFFHVPCPHCGVYQRLIWKNIRWTDSNPETTQYYCSDCGQGISERHKSKMIKNGKWVKTAQSKIAGFHISELYILDTSWESLVEDWLKINKDKNQLQVFINTRLGETFDDRGEAPDFLILYGKREFYLSVPDDVLFLTAAVDVQADRIEVETRGWGRTQSWSIDHSIFFGDTSSQEVYKNLENLLDKNFDGLKIRALGIDTGYNTHAVYFWAARQDSTRVFAMKGQTLDSIIGLPKAVDINYQGRKISNGLKLWGINSSILKSELYSKLQLTDKNAPGYVHFPDYPEEYFAQLVSEVLTTKTVNGRRRYNWEKTRERNEALDLAIYNRAVAIILGIEKLNNSDWVRMEELKNLQKNKQGSNIFVQNKQNRRIVHNRPKND